ncbi:MAG: hypothetical protein H6549_03785 [Chitinophagales bacterium]|nr:hypothetical protein [Chitinophagales bacterium]
MKHIILSFGFLTLFFCFAGQCQITKSEKITDKNKLTQLKSHSVQVKKIFPSFQEIDMSKKLSQDGKMFFKKFREIIDRASKTTDNTSTEEYNSIMSDLGWAMFIIKTSFSESNNGTNSNSTAKRRGSNTMSEFSSWVFADGGNKDKTCATKCRDDYNKCMTENDCNYDRDSVFGICLCCTPCSLQYAGCLARCVISGNNNGVIQ